MRFSELVLEPSLIQRHRDLEVVALHCDGCGNPFTRTRRRFMDALRKKTRRLFCSRDCQHTAQITRAKLPCTVCGTVIERTQSQKARYPHHFCSRSCNISFQNRVSPKREKGWRPCRAPDCEALVSAARRIYCDACKPQTITKANALHWLEGLGNLGDVRRAALYQVHAEVRRVARKVYEVLEMSKVCLICGYRRVDVCHIRAIGTFLMTTPLAVINHPFNLMGLCKNHHGEFDRGGLSEEDTLKLTIAWASN